LTLLQAGIEDREAELGSPAVKIVELSKRFSGRYRRFSFSRNFLNSLFIGSKWEIVALDKVNFHINHGEVFGLLGPNGSGKTTLIKILSNLVLPDSGTAYVEGINVGKHPYSAAEKIQTVLSESSGLEKRVSARSNLQLFASLYNIPRKEADERIDYLFDYFGIEDFADRSSQSLSTGMNRKLTVCRVLLSNAPVIVFDEPTSGLDPVSADNFRRLIMEDLVKHEKKTIMMATHNLTEAMSMCDRIGLLSHGRVLAVGTPEEISKSVGDRVEMTVDLQGDGTGLGTLKEELAKTEGIDSVMIESPNGGVRVRLTGRRDLNYYEVLSVIDRGGFRVVSLESSAPSLEDAFLKLTKEGGK
jgi:ABC-2 type transport system ATP-binding protein